MKIVCFNLDHARARRKKMTEQFRKLNLKFEFITAIDTNSLTDEQASKVDWEKRNKLGLSQSPGDIGCWLTHTKFLSDFVQSDLDKIAVFEDDAGLDSNLPHVLDLIDNTSFDFGIIKLHRLYTFKPYFPVHSLSPIYTLGLVKTADLAAIGYIITRKAAKSLLKSLSKMVLPIDMEMNRYWLHQVKAYSLDPPVVNHSDEEISFIKSSQLPSRFQNLTSSKTIPSRLYFLRHKWIESYKKRTSFHLLLRNSTSKNE